MPSSSGSVASRRMRRGSLRSDAWAAVAAIGLGVATSDATVAQVRSVQPAPLPSLTTEELQTERATDLRRRAVLPAPPRPAIRTLSGGGDLRPPFQLDASPTTERATQALDYGNVLAREAAETKQPALLEEATGYLRYSIDHGSDREKIVARNNYASVAVRLGRVDEAKATFEQGYASAKRLGDRSAQAHYFFNYGRFVELHGDRAKALPLYREAYLANPRRPQAAQAGVSLALKLGALDEAATLLQALVADGHPAVAEPYLKALIADGAQTDRSEFASIIEVLFDYLPATRIGPEAFQETWRDPLRRLARRLAAPARQRLKLVLDAYGGDINVVFELPEARMRYAPWGGDPYDSRRASQVLAKPSRFLTAVGELQADRGDLKSALALYSVGWAMDTANLDAGLYAANLLLEYPTKLDPRGYHLSQFVNNLFAGKSEAYLGNDLPNILRFHTILGTIFSRRGEWGNSRQGRSAIFQWEHAVQTSESLAAQGRVEEAAVPGLHTKLAEAYKAVGRTSDAFDSYLSAADAALRLGDRDLAQSVLRSDLSTLSYSPTAVQVRRLDALGRRI